MRLNYRNIIVIILLLPVFLKAKDDADSLKQLLSPPMTNVSKTTIYFKIAEVYLESNLDSCYKYAKQAAVLANRFGDDHLLIKSNLFIARIKYLTHQFDSTIIYLDRSEKLANKLNDSTILGLLYEKRGAAIAELGNNFEARTWLRKSALISIIIGDTGAQIHAQIELSNTFKKIGENDSVIYYLDKAQKLYYQIGDTAMIGKSLINLSSLYLGLGEFERAEEFALESIRLYKKHNQLKILYLAYAQMGKINQMRNKFRLATIYYDSSLLILKQFPNSPGEADLHLNIASLSLEMNNLDKALLEYTHARKIFSRIKYIYSELEVLRKMSSLFERIGNFEKSQQTYDSAIVIAKNYQYFEALASLYYNKFKAYEKTAEYHKAFDFQTLYHKTKDSIYSLVKTKFIKDLEFKYKEEKKDAHILQLKHDALTKDARLRDYQYKVTVGVILFAAVFIVLLLLVYFQKQKEKKNKIIHEKEVTTLLEKEKSAAARALLEGQEEERKRVSMELHDGLGVMLSNLKMQFSNFIARSGQNNEVLYKAATVIDNAAIDVRRISHNMMPSVLTRFGLNISLEELIDDMNDIEGVSASISLKGDDKKLSDNIQIMIYRIIQELVNNTIKHSSASQVSLILNYGSAELKILYSDNGIGYSPKLMSSSLGLKSITSRVRFLGGELVNESNPGKGVSYIINIPF